MQGRLRRSGAGGQANDGGACGSSHFGEGESKTLNTQSKNNIKFITLLLLYYFTGTDADTDTYSHGNWCLQMPHLN